METQTPGPAQLLKLAGDDDTAAFAALYDVTSPQVFGMLTALFPIEHDALQATTDAYTSLWRQAPHFTFDFNVDHADEIARDRTVVDRKSTRLNSSHVSISYAVFCLKKKSM